MDDERDERDDTAGSALIQAFAHFVRVAKSWDPSVEALPEGLLSIADAARYLNVSTTTVRNLAVGAKVRSTRIGDRIRFRRVWLDQWIDAGGGEVPPPPPVSPRPEAEAPKARPVARPARRRPEPKPKPPTCIQRIGDQELRLLADKSGDHFGRFYTWHVGMRTPICGAAGHWTHSLERWPRATYCPRCLTALAAFPEADLALFGVGRVYMMRTTTRGATPTPLRAGYHGGNGRRTLCGKTDGPWALTEREPRARQCFVCDHRTRWDNRNLDSNRFGPRPITPLRVLVDAGPLDPRLTELIGAHPRSLDARQATEPVPDHASYSFDKWAAVFGPGDRIGAFQDPPLGTVSQSTDWATYTISDRPNVGIEMSDLTLERLEDWAQTFERAIVLYAKWAKEAAQKKR